MRQAERSAAPDGMYDFDLVPFIERSLVVIGAGNYLEVESDSDMRARDIQLFEHLGNGPARL